MRDSQLQILWLARIDYLPQTEVYTHHHDFYQLLLILDGEGLVTINDQSYPIKKDTVFLFPKGMAHRFEFVKPTVTLDFKFDVSSSSIEHLLSKRRLSGKCPRLEKEELKKWYTLSRNIDVCTDSFRVYRIDAGFKSTLLSLITHLIEHQTDQIIAYCDHYQSTEYLNKVNPHVPRSDHLIVNYVETNYREKITLNQLARQYNYHPHYIIQIFQEEVGMSPIQYLQQIRLRKACYYLEFSTLSISEIAEKIGISSPYFSKLFHEKIGKSPTHYRKYHYGFIGKEIVLTKNFLNQ